MTPHLVQRDFLSVVEQAALLAWRWAMRRGSRRPGSGAPGVNAAVRRSAKGHWGALVLGCASHPTPSGEGKKKLDIVANMFLFCSMNAQAAIMADEARHDDAPPDPEGVGTERLLRVLERLTDLGMEVAERLAAKARDEALDVGELGEVAVAFAKVSRSVRMTVMIEDKLAKARRLHEAGIADTREAERQARLRAAWAVGDDEREALAGRRQSAIKGAVQDVIRAEQPERFERELLFDRFERLWADDLSGDLYAKPDLYLQVGGDDALISQQVAAFCKALDDGAAGARRGGADGADRPAG